MGADGPREGAQSRGEVKDGPRRHQFYGRRVGHALRRHQAALMTELLPGLRVDLVQPLADTGERRFLEIGFGGGEHLAHLAELHPETAILGAEPFVNGVAKLLALVEARKLANVRIHDGDGRDLLDALPAAAFERVYLLYPDPWPKARHNRRRFVNAETLAQIHRVLRPGGLFLFASDIPDYVAWTRERIAAHGGFREEGDPTSSFADWIETRYEAKARREGRKSAYLRLRRTS